MKDNNTNYEKALKKISENNKNIKYYCIQKEKPEQSAQIHLVV